MTKLWERRPSLSGLVVGAAGMWLAILYGWVDGAPARTFEFTKFAPLGSDLGCKALASATLNEEVTLAEPNKWRGKLKVTADRGTDTLSMRVEGAKLLVLSGASHKIGTMQPEAMDIIRDDKRALVAVQITPNGNVYTFRLDRETGNAVWGKVGEFILGGAMGWTHYLECR